MKVFKYIARDAEGQQKKGLGRALSPDEIATYLRDQGLTPISITPVSLGVRETGRLSSVKKIKAGELAAVCWQLNTMLEGGVQVAAALETIDEDIENLRLRRVLQQVLEKMKQGHPFSEGIAAFPEVFNHLSRAIILAGETEGNLPMAMQRLAEYFDGRDVLAKKIKGAIAYPIFVFCFVVVVVIGIMTFIIPRFEIVFKQFGGDLPQFTKIYMACYYAVRSNVLPILATMLSLLLAGIVASKTKIGHRFFSKVILKIPIIGKVVKQSFIAIFCRTLSTLFAAGVPVVDTFNILGSMTNNDIIRESITRTHDNIVEGANVSMSLADAGFFPNMVVKMTQIGEEAGSLPKVLGKTAVYYERKVDVMLTTAMALLEPMMIIVVGVIVLITVLALYLPIFARTM